MVVNVVSVLVSGKRMVVNGLSVVLSVGWLSKVMAEVTAVCSTVLDESVRFSCVEAKEVVEVGE
jgi:hypothetical protein